MHGNNMLRVEYKKRGPVMGLSSIINCIGDYSVTSDTITPTQYFELLFAFALWCTNLCNRIEHNLCIVKLDKSFWIAFGRNPVLGLK